MDYEKFHFMDDKVLMGLVTKAIGETFREERKKQKISQHRVSDSANINNSYYSLIENGEVNPSIYKYLMICNSLGIVPTIAISNIMEKLAKEIDAVIAKESNK